MNQKILLTTPTFPPINSGLGNAVQQLAKYFVEESWEVVVATGGNARNQYKDPLSGALVEQFNVSGADSIAQTLRGDVGSYLGYLKTCQFDIILMNAWQAWSTDLVLSHCELIDGKKLLYSHCISTNSIIGPPSLRSLFRYLAWRPYWWSLPKKIKKLDSIIFLADRGCDARFDDAKLAKRLGVRQIVIPNCLCSAAALALDLPSNEFQGRNGLLSIGAYEWQKGHDFVLKAYALSSAKNKIQLNFYGQSYTPYLERLHDLASSLGLDSHYVHFHEGVNQATLFQEYTEAQLFLYGSCTECQPIVILDAMAAGTPFISKASGSIPYMKGGISVRSTVEAGAIIDRLLWDQNEWMSLSQDGRMEAREKHTPEKVRNLLSKVFY